MRSLRVIHSAATCASTLVLRARALACVASSSSCLARPACERNRVAPPHQRTVRGPDCSAADGRHATLEQCCAHAHATRLDASLALGRLDVHLVPLRRALKDLGSRARLLVRPLPARGQTRGVCQSGSGHGAARGPQIPARGTHFPSSSAALRRRAAALALTAACSHRPSACFVGCSAAAPSFSSFSSEEPCRGMMARVVAAASSSPACGKGARLADLGHAKEKCALACTHRTGGQTAMPRLTLLFRTAQQRLASRAATTFQERGASNESRRARADGRRVAERAALAQRYLLFGGQLRCGTSADRASL